MSTSTLALGLYHPLKTANLSLWLAADKVTGLSDGAGVATWSDLSGNSNDFIQNTSSKQPTYKVNQVNGLPALQFVSANSSIMTNSTGVPNLLSGNNIPHTVSIVIQATSFTAYNQWFYVISTSGGHAITSYSLKIPDSGSDYHVGYTDDNSVNVGFNAGVTDTNWHILTVRFNGSTVDQWVDGQLVMDTIPLTFGTQTFNQANLGRIIDGSIAELTLYNTALSRQEINRLHYYFSHRYGISIDPIVNSNHYGRPGPVEVFPAVTATKLSGSLGFNMQGTYNKTWNGVKALQYAKNAGATEVRWQPGWEAVEAWSSTPNTPGAFNLGTTHETGLTDCASIGLEPRLVAAYGAPRQTILTVTTASDVPAGSYDIPVNQDISSVITPYCHIIQSNGTQIVAAGKWAYYGGLIDSVNTGTKTITLASKTAISLPAGTSLKINQLLYASINSLSPNDVSVQGYCRYAAFMADRIAAHGLNGFVELWNEPVWAHDGWDARPLFYDDATNPNISATWAQRSQMSPAHAGILQNLLNTTPPAGVRYDNAGTHKTGSGSILQFSPTQTQLDASFATQSIHPYGDYPESKSWYPWDYAYPTMGAISGDYTNNWAGMARNMKTQQSTLGPNFGLCITEHGCGTTDDEIQARYFMRAFLYWCAIGMTRVNFYDLANGDSNQIMVPGTSTQDPVPRQAYTALSNFMGLLNSIKGTPDSSVANNLPVVRAYNGDFPLSVVPVPASGKTLLWCSWQRTVNFDGNSPYRTIDSPIATDVYLKVPAGITIGSAFDTVTMNPVTAVMKGKYLYYQVADNPIAIQLTYP